MDEPLSIAVCEDTKADEEHLIELLKLSKIKNNYTVFTCGEDFLVAYSPQSFDLLLSDIYMGGISGIETVKNLREKDEDIPVAFITSSADHTLESYRLNVLKYIEKPFKQKDIDDILHLALIEKNSAPALTLRRSGKDERIPYNRILYLEQQAHRLFVHLKDGTAVQFYEKLSDVLPQLEENNFFNSHKSYSVNLAFVCDIDTELKCFTMKDGAKIPIRRESTGKAKKAFENFLFNNTRGL